MTEARGEIGRSDEQAIDARRGGNLLHFVHRLRGFDLHDRGDLRVRVLHVVAPHAVRARARTAPATPRRPSSASAVGYWVRRTA
jgi:hypothetical protein